MWTRICYGKQDMPFNYSEFICDTEDDLDSLPTNEKYTGKNPMLVSCAIGSEAIVVNSRTKYILNNDNKWELLIDYVSTGGSESGSNILTESLTATTTIGSVTSGKTYARGTNLEDIIRDILTTYQKAGLAVSLNPTDEIYDIVTDTLSNIIISASTTKGTNDITSITFFINGVEVNEVTTDVANGGTFNYNHSFPTSQKSTFSVKVEVSDGEQITSQTKNIVFVGKSYYGTADDTITSFDETLVKSLSSVLKNSKKYTYQNITIDFGRVIYAIPKTLGHITSIKDEVNNFDYTNSFEESEIIIDGYDYYLYILKDSVSASNVSITFA